MTENENRIAVDSGQLEQMQIIEDSSCCLKVRAVISKVGVYDYSDQAKPGEPRFLLKSAHGLLNATRTARATKITLLDHPTTVMPVITSQEQLFGEISNARDERPFFDRDKIRAVLNFDKHLSPAAFLDKVRAAATRQGPPIDNSIGFFHKLEKTPTGQLVSGKWKDPNTGKEVPYDAIMTDMVIDHVAVGVPIGRCSSAMGCGLGVDSAQLPDTSKLPALRIDAAYPWDQCVSDRMAEGKSEESANRICAAIKNSTVQHASEFSGIKDMRKASELVLLKCAQDKLFAYELDQAAKAFMKADLAANFCAICGTKLEANKCPNEKCAVFDKAVNVLGAAAPVNDKLKNEFVDAKVKGGMTKEEAETLYTELTTPPATGKEGEGAGAPDDKKGEEGAGEGEGEPAKTVNPVEVPTEKLLEEATKELEKAQAVEQTLGSESQAAEIEKRRPKA
jgi:hypothetical protein